MKLFPRNVGRLALVGGTVTLSASYISLYLDTPTADFGDGSYDPTRQRSAAPVPEWFQNIARAPVIGVVTALCHFFLKVTNRFSSTNEHILADALLNRPPGTPVITVSNHTATLDDPATLVCMLPLRCSTPKMSRWSLCSQEYSYTKGPLVSSFFYAGKVLPIVRGGGIDHKMLEMIFDKVRAGDWVHIFPEGAISQNTVLGGRKSPRREEIGCLKWGVGKLIARAPVRPIVIPLYHKQMDRMFPQDANNRLLYRMPQSGNHIQVRVGEPIDFEDLFEQFADAVQSEDAPWKTQEAEKQLYSAIMRRIESKLLTLEQEMRTQ